MLASLQSNTYNFHLPVDIHARQIKIAASTVLLYCCSTPGSQVVAFQCRFKSAY